MVLAMDSRYESHSLGRELSLAWVAETVALAGKHGFRLSGLRSFEQVVSEEAIEKVRQRAYQKRLSPDQGHPARGAVKWKSPSTETKIAARYRGYLGETKALISRVLADHRRARKRRR